MSVSYLEFPCRVIWRDLGIALVLQACYVSQDCDVDLHLKGQTAVHFCMDPISADFHDNISDGHAGIGPEIFIFENGNVANQFSVTVVI